MIINEVLDVNGDLSPKEIEKIKIKQELKGLRTVALLKASRGMKLEEVIEKGI